MAELLFWPALLAYGEAAVAYFGEARHPGRAGRLATWGVRVGWLVQTALLAVQAARADGFPWSTWAGSLNLFVWLVVGAYLIWGCQPRYRLLGLARAAAGGRAAWCLRALGGGTGDRPDRVTTRTCSSSCMSGSCWRRSRASRSRPRLSALYLWQERRLKRRESTIFRFRAPALATARRVVAARTIAVALPALTLGIAVGIVRLTRRAGRRLRRC